MTNDSGGAPVRQWLQVHIACQGSVTDEVCRILEGFGALSVTLTDQADSPIYEPDPARPPVWPDTQVSALFQSGDQHITDLLNNLEQHCQSLDIHDIRHEWISDQDWERAWMKDFRPMQFGRRLWVCPGNQLPPDPRACNVMLDPGLAFGTGTHETTALCLEWLDQTEVKGKMVCDYGCGSGILGIAAALLGARGVVAIDIDPQALTATRNNASRNRVQDLIDTYPSDQVPRQQFDILLANILANPLKQLSGSLFEITRPGGSLILSGILSDQKEAVWNAYSPFFKLDRIQQRQDWIAILAHRSE